MVGKTKIVVVDCRRDGVGLVVTVENRSPGSDGAGVSGIVVAVVGRDGAGGSLLAGTVVVVAVEPDEGAEDPEPEVEPEPEAAADVEPEPAPPDDDEDEPTVATGVRALPVRSGTVPGGVSSGGLALLMKRLKIWAGSEPPLTLATPST
jgi:hypothetical protein